MNKKKKILLMVPLPPPMHGSNIVNQYVVNNADLRERYDVKIFPLRYASSVADIGRFNLLKLITFLRYVAGVLFLLRDFRPNYVYFVPAVTGLSFYRDCLFALIFKMLRVRLIIHLHGRGIKQQIRNPVVKRIYVWFFRNEHIIHLSPLLFEDVVDVVEDGQVSFLPNGIDVSHSFAEKHNQGHGGRFRILFLSNLLLNKGPLMLLDACKILADKGYEYEACYVGNATQELSYEELNKRIKAYGLQNHIRCLGPKYGKDKEEILLASDVFVLPGYGTECFPLALLEAMAFALPVVSTSIGAIPEIVDDGRTGFLLGTADPRQLADKLECLINNREACLRMGNAGRHKFEMNYRLDRFHKNFLRLMAKFTDGS